MISTTYEQKASLNEYITTEYHNKAVASEASWTAAAYVTLT